MLHDEAVIVMPASGVGAIDMLHDEAVIVMPASGVGAIDMPIVVCAEARMLVTGDNGAGGMSCRSLVNGLLPKYPLPNLILSSSL
jgi:hypothetical protein